MGPRFLMGLMFLLISCKEDSTEFKSQQEMIIALQQENMELKQTIKAIKEQMDYLSEALYRDEKGDIIVEGANLQIRNGSSDSYEKNGKGNLIIGYNELLYENGTCEGGQNEGESCKSDVHCTSPNAVLRGFCKGENVLSKRTGSHNLVIGAEHSYDAVMSIVSGRRHTVDIRGTAIGGYHNTASDSDVVVGGRDNIAKGGEAVIVGGMNNKAEHAWTVSVGGSEQSVWIVDQPGLGDWGKMINDIGNIINNGRLSYLGLLETIDENCRCD